jgi:hypothetical protein
MSRVRWAVTISVVATITGVAGSLVPFVAHLEESVGLPLLFLARGASRPPDQVVLVTLDEEAATRTGLPRLIRDWPRSAYATLVDRLVERGASAIAFDVQFFRHGNPDADREFAEAIARSRRTVLIQRLEIVRPAGSEFLERQDPIPVLANAALGLAPVPMPDVAVVSWLWSFLDVPIVGEMPTLPAVMLQAKAMPVTSDFLDIAVGAGVEGLEGIPRSAGDIHRSSDLLRLMQTLRRQIERRPSAVANIVRSAHSRPSRRAC